MIYKMKNIIESNDLTPQQIVEKLNKTIEGQYDAKKHISIVLRNINRRNRLIEVNDEMASEVLPQHILITGPTGTGKSELFKRVGSLMNKPILMVTATQYTEVGYVGNDIYSVVEELVTVAKKQIEGLLHKELKTKARNKAINVIVKILSKKSDDEETIKQIKEKLLSGELDDIQIEIQVSNNSDNSSSQSKRPGPVGVSVFVSETLGKIFSSNDKKRKITDIGTAIELLMKEEINKMLDQEAITRYAIEFAEKNGIIFIDEIDKLCKTDMDQRGAVSTKGVQRDLLSLLSGTTVETKYGTVDTSRILFVAAGAFYLAKPKDLMPELQGRLSTVVDFHALDKKNLINILNNPIKGLIKQNIHLLKTENVIIEFDKKAVERIADYAVEMNAKKENIGARRLSTIMSHLMRELAYECSYNKNTKKYLIDEEYVDRRLKDFIDQQKWELYMI